MQLSDVPAAVWTTISAIGVAVASGIFTAWASKAKTKADVQTVINEGFSQLVDKLNNRIKDAEEEADRCHGEINRLRNERERLLNSIEVFRQQNNDFKNTLVRNNIPIKKGPK